jgi:hypothetical protein
VRAVRHRGRRRRRRRRRRPSRCGPSQHTRPRRRRRCAVWGGGCAQIGAPRSDGPGRGLRGVGGRVQPRPPSLPRGRHPLGCADQNPPLLKSCRAHRPPDERLAAADEPPAVRGRRDRPHRGGVAAAAGLCAPGRARARARWWVCSGTGSRGIGVGFGGAVQARRAGVGRLPRQLPFCREPVSGRTPNPGSSGGLCRRPPVRQYAPSSSMDARRGR